MRDSKRSRFFRRLGIMRLKWPHGAGEGGRAFHIAIGGEVPAAGDGTPRGLRGHTLRFECGHGLREHSRHLIDRPQEGLGLGGGTLRHPSPCEADRAGYGQECGGNGRGTDTEQKESETSQPHHGQEPITPTHQMLPASTGACLFVGSFARFPFRYFNIFDIILCKRYYLFSRTLHNLATPGHYHIRNPLAILENDGHTNSAVTYLWSLATLFCRNFGISTMKLSKFPFLMGQLNFPNIFGIKRNCLMPFHFADIL